MRAFLLVDLGFGDAGKGLLTDFLVRRTGATVVVRYNGGAQAGHNVVTPDGRHHTFAQFGSGTFVEGVRTFLSRHVVIHPAGLLAEAAALQAKGVGDALSRLRVSEGALVITPFHQAAGRLRELARGAGRHGSCGVGVGEAVGDALERPDEAVLAGDLRDPARLRPRVRRLRERKREEMAALAGAIPAGPAGDAAARELAVFAGDDLLDRWLAEAARLAALGLVVPDSTLADWLGGAAAVVFEGAQGVLLDERAGFHPYTTWSRCTLDNALELLAEAAPGAEVRRIGVLRAHAVRHGPGPLPTETGELRPAVRDHNGFGEWQGAVRYGWFDAVLARYALDVAGPLEGLALTHLDAPARLGRWRVCAGYEASVGSEISPLLAERAAGGAAARLTDLLLQARPVLEDCEPAEAAVVQRTERLLGRGVDLLSRGPRSTDVTLGTDRASLDQSAG
ncbi:MAG TPA: adenylosuccinate synthetase [Thermoanaerobaculia bacterium]|nr:adenylosuccinate synthetase [Thermoanaerobaculia bacterium]